MGVRGRWPGHQLSFVKLYYGVRPARWIARHLDRREQAVHEKAALFFTGRAVSWSAADTARLSEALLHRVPVAEIARRLVVPAAEIQAEIQARREVAKDLPLPASEVRDFKRFYGGVPDPDLIAVFGVTANRVQEAADRFLLHKDKAMTSKLGIKTKMPRWPSADETKLRELYPATSNTELARILGRSVKSVVSKAHEMCLKKSLSRLQEMGRENVAVRYPPR